MDKIRVTYTLLNKPQDELTEDERKAVERHKANRKHQFDVMEKNNAEIVSDCKMLFSGCEHVPIPDFGWTYPVRKLCYDLEGLNYDYRKYRLRVVVDQTKEKYGTLRFYTTIRVGNTGFMGRLADIAEKITEKLSDVNYRLTFIQEMPEYKTLEWREVDKLRYDKMEPDFAKTAVKVSSRDEVKEVSSGETTTYFLEEDGKFYTSYLLTHLRTGRKVPTRHRLLFRLRNMFLKVENFLIKFVPDRPKSQVVKLEEFERKVFDLTSRAERECHGVCQHCGIPFSEHYPRCETLGWYTYVCEDCACATGARYRKDGKTYLEGVEQKADEKVEEKIEEESNEVR